MAKSLRFLHAADLHLGATFSGLVSSDGAFGSLLVDAVSAAWKRVVRIAVEQEVDFVILAGDSFNEGEPPYRVYRDFLEGLDLLKGAGISVYLCTGNHDPSPTWEKRLAVLSDKVSLFGADKPSYFRFEREDGTSAVLAGRSYLTSYEAGEDMADKLTRKKAENACGTADFSIGVLHTGGPGSNYAPVSVTTLKEAGFDYWALGHIHQYGAAVEGLAYYPGTPQGLDINEAGSHGCLLVTLEKGMQPGVEFVSTETVAWRKPTLSIEGLETPDDLLEALTLEGQRLLSQCGMPVVCRFALEGRGPLHAFLENTEDVRDLLDEVEGRASSGSLSLRVDDIIDATAPALDVEALAAGGLFPAALIEEANTRKTPSLTQECESGLAAFSLSGFTQSQDLEAVEDSARTLCLDLLMGGGK